MLVTISISLMSIMTVFAYSDLAIIENMTESEARGLTVRIPSKEEMSSSYRNKISLPESGTSVYYIDRTGTAKFANTMNHDDEKASCAHVYYDGEIITHAKKSNGGCKETYYNAKICEKCGSYIKGSRINTVEYDVCIH